MTTVQQINIVLSLLASFGSLLIARSAWKRRYTPGAYWFIGLVLCVTWVTFWYIFEAAAGFDLNLYISFTKLEYVGLTYIPVFWLGFALRYSGVERPLPAWVLRILVILPIITIAITWTNDWHGLIWSEPRIFDRAGIPTYEPVYGAWFWVYMIYSYSIFLLGSFVLARQALGTWRLYRAQAAMLLIGTVLPWLSNLLQVFDDLNPFPGVYINAIFLGTAMFSLSIGLIRLRLLDVMPLARDTILKNIPVGFAVVDTQMRVLAFNPSVAPYLNEPERDPIGRLLNDIFTGLPGEAFNPEYTGAQRWQQQEKVIDITVTPVIDWRGNRRGQLLVFNDVTAQVEAQQALEAVEKRQRALLEALPDLMFRIRDDGTYVDYHAANPDDLLASPEAFLNRKITEVLPAEPAEAMMAHIRRVLSTGEIATYEYAVTLGEKQHAFEARIVASGANEVVATVRNIEARQEAERRALALALERERIAMIARFVQDTTHEFRTPLSVIRVSLHLLTRTEDYEKRLQRAEQIEQQVSRLVHLVDVLVKMSTLDGAVHFSYQSVDINQLIHMLAEKRSHHFPADLPTLCLNLQPDLPLVRLDATRILEAVQELVNNAVHHTLPEGFVTLRTYSDDSHVTIEVSDTGTGMSENEVKRIFERFYRADNAHSTPGFGLGLSIAQRIVEVHGGRIDVNSEPGKGSVFRICLPLKREPRAQAFAAGENLAETSRS